MDKVANQINKGKPDPITNRSMSDACWNNKHRGQSQFTPVCTGWKEACAKCIKEIDKERHLKQCPCSCHNRPCQCACHDPQEYKPKVKRDKNSSMHILDSGCGTIEVK